MGGIVKMAMTHFDAIIIGAGISGISAAYHLQKYNPSKTYTILERRAALGGTWDLFKYPGVRSDSDMYTFGYSFRHWEDQSTIAEKSKIIDYLKSTVDEYGIDKNIQYQQSIVKARWSSAEMLWRLDSGEGREFTCQFLYMCSGYYRYDEGYTPDFAGIDNFKGSVIHPQLWRSNTDYNDKNIVVIGSGATAITLVPSLAKKAKHVTMLQRSPSYISSQPSVSPMVNLLSRLLGRWAARWWFIVSSIFIYWCSKTFPSRIQNKLLKEIREHLGDKYEEKHFKPHYNPWDQRVCVCPDGDFLNAIKSGQASIETDHIAEFHESGVLLKSGKFLHADMVVTATGLQIQLFGGIEFEIDGQALNAHESYVYKGMMLSGVPNMFMAIGYTNASWTLKVDLTHRYASRLIDYMDKRGFNKCSAQSNTKLQEAPLLNLSSGYIQRSLAKLPKQAATKPWRLNQNYILDTLALRLTAVDDKHLEFS